MALRDPSRRGCLIGSAALVLGARAVRAQGAVGPVVETRAGRVLGRLEESVVVFKGLRYGETTAGAGRFRPPQPVRPWSGVYEATSFGPKAPQPARFGAPMTGAEGAPGQSEDCLRLNIWTPAVSGPGRPVMVWLHGGGFSNGSGGAPEFDGAHLARNHDVVVVTLNHRLGALGFLYLDQLTGELVPTANLGLLDVAAALAWVRDNIAAFGGDPGCITLFGESGGGRKVATFSAMPIGQGLYQRLIIQSGPATRQLTPERATAYADAFLRVLGVGPDLTTLQAIPVDAILRAQVAVQPPPDMPLDNVIKGFAPVVDGRTLPHDAYSETAPALSAGVPMLIGCNRWEQAAMDRDPAIWDRTLGWDELTRRLQTILRGRTNTALEFYRRDYPKLDPAELFLRIDTDRSYWVNSVRIAELRAAEGRAATFMYRLDWETPVEGGRLKTPHGLDVPLVFDTVEARRDFEGPGEAPLAIAHRMSAAWTAFARTGAPEDPLIPTWPPYAPPKRATMVIDTDWRLLDDPDSAERRLLQQVV